jgi:beta-fructofuranosidase
MVCGTGKEDVGKIVMYTSKDLFHWDYSGVLLEGSQYGNVIECPDLFQYKDKFILMFSQMGKVSHAIMFVYGDFDGRTFTPISYHTPEAGPHFYAPQTFLDEKGRRIIIAWLYSWDKKVEEGIEYAGALTIPREIFMKEGEICMFPVREAEGLLVSEDSFLQIEDKKLKIPSLQFEIELNLVEEIKEVAILKDTKTIEIFLNGGEESITYWFDTNL